MIATQVHKTCFRTALDGQIHFSCGFFWRWRDRPAESSSNFSPCAKSCSSVWKRSEKASEKENMKANTTNKKPARTQNPASSDDPADQAQNRKDMCEAGTTKCIEIEQASDT